MMPFASHRYASCSRLHALVAGTQNAASGLRSAVAAESLLSSNVSLVLLQCPLQMHSNGDSGSVQFLSDWMPTPVLEEGCTMTQAEKRLYIPPPGFAYCLPSLLSCLSTLDGLLTVAVIQHAAYCRAPPMPISDARAVKSQHSRQQDQQYCTSAGMPSISPAYELLTRCRCAKLHGARVDWTCCQYLSIAQAHAISL